jgi:hypothetical protein
VNIRPIGPCPATRTLSPGNSARRFTAFNTVLTGSSIAPSSNEFFAGIFTTPGSTKGITRTYSEKPPPAGSNPAVMPVRL